MYFYPAVISSRVSDQEVQVTFLADNIERTVGLETGIISIEQLRPGNLLTVKHDVYKAYEVTAELLKFPIKRGSRDFDYQIKISATDSEPQNNEDSRVVSHEEITLNGELSVCKLLLDNVSITDSQATAILRSSGLEPTSSTVSANVDLSNLMFRKLKSARPFNCLSLSS